MDSALEVRGPESVPDERHWHTYYSESGKAPDAEISKEYSFLEDLDQGHGKLPEACSNVACNLLSKDSQHIRDDWYLAF